MPINLQLVRQLNALGQSTRMAIVQVLCQEGELSYHFIAEHVQLYQGLYYHLKMLKSTGLIATRKIGGKRVVYFANDNVIEELRTGLADLMFTSEGVHV